MNIELIEEKVKINDLDLNYRVTKPEKSKKNILILHGWGAISFSWHNTAYLLAEAGYNIIAVDLPGFGDTPPPKDIWGTDEYVDFIHSFCKKKGLKDFVLLGHSFGGALSLKFTYNHPELLHKLILCDAAAVRKERLNFRQKTAKALSKYGSKIVAKTPFYHFFEMMAYRLAGSYDYYKANPIMREIFKKIIVDDMSDIAEKVKTDCLIIWGREDLATPIEDAFILNELMENSYLKVITEARHNPYRTHAKKVARIIINYLEK